MRDFERFVEGRFERLELFMALMIRGFHKMTTGFDRLTQSVGALGDQIDANDTELSTLAQEIRDMRGSTVTDDQLNALADKLDASRGNLKTAADAAADALAAHTGGDTTTATGGGGADSVTA
jgi:hypothetical protein